MAQIPGGIHRGVAGPERDPPSGITGLEKGARYPRAIRGVGTPPPGVPRMPLSAGSDRILLSRNGV